MTVFNEKTVYPLLWMGGVQTFSSNKITARSPIYKLGHTITALIKAD